ncbi:LysR substrate-binding domain-containing protein [Xylophilus sp. GOD-11R]|uniref:LysR substrate-binding domain-containing protein n=1 Tax=Xylophilus sp. GOD-11R TaxID=3089814 RepID=UPI00298CC5FA|nr:LysR substrate-binding domain-containing protein [Xylophilus sp. GOD-11R]WPB55437.1 LysR substrate-binding domain-containing protein [Xylophilus sp. GOD-11R]
MEQGLDHSRIAAEPATRRGLSVGVPPLIAESLVVPVVRRFVRQNPGLALRLHEDPSVELLDLTALGEIDLAIVYNVSPRAALQLETVAQDDLQLIGAAHRPPMRTPGPIALAEVLGLPLFMPRSGAGLHGMLDEAARQRGVMPDISFRIDGIAPILSLVREGLGFTCLPYSAVASRIANGELRARPIVDPVLPGVLSIAASATRPRSDAMERFCRCIRDEPILRLSDSARRRPGSASIDEARITGMSTDARRAAPP